MSSNCLLMNSMLGMPISHKPFHPRATSLATRANFLGSRGSWTCVREMKQGSSLWNLATVKTEFLTGGNDSRLLPVIPKLPKRRPCLPPRASNDAVFSFQHPPMSKKPRWWWRSLACLPYLMPLHQTWTFSDMVYQIHPFLEKYEFLVEPFFRASARLPTWFPLFYFLAAYLWVVRRKEWPHFLRFHVEMGLLLEIALQVLGKVSRSMPVGLKWGKPLTHLWTAAALAFFFTVLECIRCALVGMYADVPFASDAAYIQIPF